MSDPLAMMGKAPGGMMGGAPGGAPGGGMMRNMSALNPNDAAVMGASGQFTPDMTVRDYLTKMGVDVDGPVTQLVDMAKKQMANANPLNKMRSMAADTSLKPGGQPQTMPGVKPMVQPPGAPAPAGIEGLLSRLGGK